MWCLSSCLLPSARRITQQLLLQTHFLEQYGKSHPGFLDSHSFLSLSSFVFIDILLNSVSFALPLLLLLFYWESTCLLLCRTNSRHRLSVHHFDFGCAVCVFRCYCFLGSVFTTFSKICSIHLRIQVFKGYCSTFDLCVSCLFLSTILDILSFS